MEVSDNRRQGRAYSDAERRRFADLIRQFGARGAREALARKVCLQTLLKIAGEFGIDLTRGRRPASAPAPSAPLGKIAA